HVRAAAAARGERRGVGAGHARVDDHRQRRHLQQRRAVGHGHDAVLGRTCRGGAVAGPSPLRLDPPGDGDRDANGSRSADAVVARPRRLSAARFHRGARIPQQLPGSSLDATPGSIPVQGTSGPAVHRAQAVVRVMRQRAQRPGATKSTEATKEKNTKKFIHFVFFLLRALRELCGYLSLCPSWRSGRCAAVAALAMFALGRPSLFSRLARVIVGRTDDPAMLQPYGIAVGPDRRVYVADTTGRALHVYTMDAPGYSTIK